MSRLPFTALSVVLGTAAVAGLGGLLQTAWWAAAIVLAAAAVLALALNDRVRPYALAALFALLCLLGVAIGVRAVGLRIPILAGLVIALAVFAAAAATFLSRVGGVAPRRALAAGVALSVLWVLLVPLAVSTAEGERQKEAVPVGSMIDVFLVLEAPAGAARPDIPVDGLLTGYDIRYSVGFREGAGVRWATIASDDESLARRAAAGEVPGQARAGALAPRPGADAVMLLVPHPTDVAFDRPQRLPVLDEADPAERLERWRSVKRAAVDGRVTTRVVVRNRRLRHRLRWRQVAPLVIAARDMGGRTLTGEAGRLATVGDDQLRLFALAQRHRPLLLFDSGETDPRPLSIESVFAGGGARLCEEGDDEADCRVVTDPKQLLNGGDRNLLIERPPDARELARHEARAVVSAGSAERDLGEDTAMYVHTARDAAGGRIYLDYWWYLPFNPAHAGAGAFCGPGLYISGYLCFDHDSDFEGLTVVLGADERPIAVHYAQHEAVVAYDWDELSAGWRSLDLGEPLRRIARSGERPLAFSARGTHATYPHRCARSCEQVAENLAEQPHDGSLPWIGSVIGQCGDGACLRLLPVRSGGTAPALWNAFDGRWGRRRCLWGVYCETASAPEAPGRQDRYAAPWDAHGSADFAGRSYRETGD